MLNEKEKYRTTAAAKSGMDPKTALKYRKIGKLPSQIQCIHDWRTRKDPFDNHWPEILKMLEVNPGLEGKTIFKYLQGKYQGYYQDGQVRTLQRRIKYWRATKGPAKELYFPQIHYPGDLCASDFTHMNSLGVTICGEQFNHLLYHFVLTYSNWETFTICYSESFESLSAGLQNAFWELGGVPKRHRSDRMSAAVNKDCNPEKFTRNYQALLRHYGITAERTNAGSANENGDVETSHRHFKRAVAQAFMLRGSKGFNNIAEYEKFLRGIAHQLNAGRSRRFEEDLNVLKGLPMMRVNDYKSIDKIKVGKSSTIHVQHNTYSVHSRLIGEKIQVRIYVDYIEIWYAQKMVERISRLRGDGKHRINYRHIIDWLVRKPGAFENYRYKADLFPSSWFRIVYDWLRSRMALRANREYVKILYCAAREGQTVTENAIRHLLEQDRLPTALNVKQQIDERMKIPPVTEVIVNNNNLGSYDVLLEGVACNG
ncbi:MAG: IS21 family transposase [Candidatus Aureabacteria bacterium]|nr:IS21 family transposase [Candidatus Auribacterota bacterium]